MWLKELEHKGPGSASSKLKLSCSLRTSWIKQMGPQPHPEGMSHYQVLASWSVGSAWLYMSPESSWLAKTFQRSEYQLKSSQSHLPISVLSGHPNISKFLQFRSLVKPLAHFPLSPAEKTYAMLFVSPHLILILFGKSLLLNMLLWRLFFHILQIWFIICLGLSHLCLWVWFTCNFFSYYPWQSYASLIKWCFMS